MERSLFLEPMCGFSAEQEHIAVSVNAEDKFALAQPAPEAGPTRTVLVMGDSLSAAYWLALQEGWVALTAERMERQAPGWRVVNTSVSGETTAGAPRGWRESWRAICRGWWSSPWGATTG